MSELYVGDRSMQITTDSCTQWPLNWYLRDFSNHVRVSQVDVDAANMPPVIIGVPTDFSAACSLPEEIPGYTSQAYVFRWHELEASVYRNFAIAPELPAWRSIWGVEENPHGLFDITQSVFNSLMTMTDADGQARLFRLVMFRDLPDSLNGYWFKVYIRNDVLPYYNEVRYGE